MALQEYETIRKTIDKTKTWINYKYKQVISREFTKGYYNFVFKYNQQFEDYDYFVIIGNESFAQDPDYRSVYVDDYGRGKMFIPKELFSVLAKDKHTDFQINLELVDCGANYNVYRIDF